MVLAMVLALARWAGAAEEKKTEARRLYDEATAAFGVGNYAEAAEKYEGSFKLHPDAALLYNAAQAYRMAGNQPRALQLYRNFVRLYADNPRTEDARNHAAALEKALAAGRPEAGVPASADARESRDARAAARSRAATARCEPERADASAGTTAGVARAAGHASRPAPMRRARRWCNGHGSGSRWARRSSAAPSRSFSPRARTPIPKPRLGRWTSGCAGASITATSCEPRCWRSR